jgi:hypothetical protein
MFAFTPIAFMIMRGVVQGISPSMEEAAQTLRASRLRTFTTVTLPLMKPGLANAFLVGFIESIADFGNPIVVGGQYAVLSTDIFFAIVGAQYDQGRAASLALILTVFALTVFFIQQKVLGRTSYTTVSGKGDAGVAMPGEFRASGGGTKSPLWRQIVADVLDVPVVTVGTAEGAAFGAAVLAAVGAGWFASVQDAEAALVATRERTDPAQPDAYSAAYASYRSLYPALQPIFPTLDG